MNRTVVVLADDLFWKTKIEHAARSAQAPAVFISEPSGLVKAAEAGKTALVLIDLAIRKDPFPAIAALKKGRRRRGSTSSAGTSTSGRTWRRGAPRQAATS